MAASTSVLQPKLYIKTTKKKATKTGPVKDKNGILRTSDPEVAEAFGEELGDQLKSGEPVDVNWNENHPFDQTEETLSQVYISPDAVRSQIKKANRGAAPGPDGIPMEAFAEGCDIIAEPLAMLYNFVNQTGKIPRIFKTTRVKMLHKKKAKDDLKNYRPLSMSNHIGNIWQRLMNEALKDHLERNGLLSRRQHGFRNKMGTTTNLMELWEHIVEVVEKEGALVELWSFDLTKAFDLLDHSKVLNLLLKSGVNGKFGECIEAWLTNRTQYIEVGSAKSKPTRVGRSCVQGSILGPTLWLVYIQSLMDLLEEENVDFFGYADDIAIVKRILSKEDQKDFEKILEILQKWAKDFAMKWSPTKT